MAKEKIGWFDWFGFRHLPDLRQAGWLGGLISVLGFGLLVVIFISVVIAFLQAVWSDDPDGVALRNTGLVLAAMIGVPFLVWRSVVAQKQVDVAEQGQITDRINKAVQGLGAEKTVKRQLLRNTGELSHVDVEGNPDFSQSILEEVTLPNLEMRIGAIYALERIAQDSLRDHIQIMEILCAFIRENARCKSLDPTDTLKDRASVTTDIQTAITVLARRSEKQRSLEWVKRFRLDLSKTDLSGANFQMGDFSGAIFIRSRLESAIFRHCKLQGTRFQGALLNHIDWCSSDLRGARLDLAILNRPRPVSGGMNLTINMADTFEGINLAGADISAVDSFGEPEETNKTFGTKDTILVGGFLHDFDERRKNLEKLQFAVHKAERERDPEATELTKLELSKTGFASWSPYSRRDMSTGQHYDQLLQQLDINGFPFQN